MSEKKSELEKSLKKFWHYCTFSEPFSCIFGVDLFSDISVKTPWKLYICMTFLSLSRVFKIFSDIFDEFLLLPAVYNFQASMFWFSCDRWVRWCNTLFVLAYCSLSKNILAQRTRVVTFVEIELIQIHHSHEKLWYDREKSRSNDDRITFWL